MLIPISLIEKDVENLLTSLGIILVAGIYFQDKTNNYGQDDMRFTNTSMLVGERFLNKRCTLMSVCEKFKHCVVCIQHT